MGLAHKSFGPHNYVPIMISHLLIGCEKKKKLYLDLLFFLKQKSKKQLIILFYNLKGGPSNYGGQHSYLDFMGFEHLNFIVFIWECYQWLKYQTISEWEHMVFWIIGNSFRSLKFVVLGTWILDNYSYIVLSKWFY